MILVTGATGFVGSHLVDRLLERGERVRILVRPTSNVRWIEGKPIERTAADLRDPGALEAAVRGVRAVLHFGGRISASRERDYMESNAEGTGNLARAFLESAPPGGTFIYCSSLAAGGPGLPAREDDPPHPVSAYGRSKLQGEHRLREILDGRSRVVILRPAAVYGPRDRSILTFFRLVERGWIIVPTPPGAVFSLIDVGSVVDATIRVLDSPAALGIYYLGDGQSHTWDDVGTEAARALGVRARRIRIPFPLTFLATAGNEAVCRISGRPPLLSFDKIREIRQMSWVCASDRASADFGFHPLRDLRAGFEETVHWYRRAGWLHSA